MAKIGDEGLVEGIDHISLPGVGQDGIIPIDEIIKEYEVDLADLPWHEMVAEDLGISLGEAIEKFAWQNSYASLAHEIREKFPGDFSGAEIRDDYTAWIGFAGKAPAAAVVARPLERY